MLYSKKFLFQLTTLTKKIRTLPVNLASTLSILNWLARILKKIFERGRICWSFYYFTFLAKWALLVGLDKSSAIDLLHSFLKLCFWWWPFLQANTRYLSPSLLPSNLLLVSISSYLWLYASICFFSASRILGLKMCTFKPGFCCNLRLVSIVIPVWILGFLSLWIKYWFSKLLFVFTLS